MKHIFIFFIFLVFSNNMISQDISGNWNWKYQDKNQTEISLESIGNDTYQGTYCSVFYTGGKIDCSDDETEFCISLSKVSENIFEGSFESPSFNGNGNIRITYSSLNPDSFKLEILSSSGEFYLPNNVFFEQ
ncbi:hypothetical protein [Flavobacterium sp. CS20]|uniref:hypothetical protein n=1 Tax=Flavobacterium sp. CS20 TaxID=2775246 RepID=UPI001B3A4216|nr:hypothetical protein [Flavobacterium sp. CS20]QTY25930.1 hypothetical protein IGB25_07820 [Flavobacterium sp. CS20]